MVEESDRCQNCKTSWFVKGQVRKIFISQPSYHYLSGPQGPTAARKDISLRRVIFIVLLVIRRRKLIWATGIRRFCQEGRHHERSAFEEGQVLLLSGHRCGLCELLVNLSGAPLRQWNTVVYLRGEVNCHFLKWTSKINTILVFELVLFQRFESLFSFRKMSSLVILGPVRLSGIKL